MPYSFSPPFFLSQAPSGDENSDGEMEDGEPGNSHDGELDSDMEANGSKDEEDVEINKESNGKRRKKDPKKGDQKAVGKGRSKEKGNKKGTNKESVVEDAGIGAGMSKMKMEQQSPSRPPPTSTIKGQENGSLSIEPVGQCRDKESVTNESVVVKQKGGYSAPKGSRNGHPNPVGDANKVNGVAATSNEAAPAMNAKPSGKKKKKKGKAKGKEAPSTPAKEVTIPATPNADKIEKGDGKGSSAAKRKQKVSSTEVL